MAIKIISDGSTDLPKSLLKEWDISVVPLSIHFENESYDSNMDLNYFYKRLKESDVLPKTSSPSPNDFYRVFQETPPDQDILVISLSSNLSSTYNHALMARDMIMEDQESPQRRIEIIDSKNASMGLGILVYKAAKLAKEGHPLEDISHFVKRKLTECRNYFVLDSLENVIKGGRLDRIRGAIAAVLNIKLLMKASEEGTLEVVEKIRGTPNAVKRLIEKIGEAGHDHLEKCVVAVAHSNCEERAKDVLDQIMKRYPFREVIVTEMGPVIGTYAGEGGVLVAYA